MYLNLTTGGDGTTGAMMKEEINGAEREKRIMNERALDVGLASVYGLDAGCRCRCGIIADYTDLSPGKTNCNFTRRLGENGNLYQLKQLS